MKTTILSSLLVTMSLTQEKGGPDIAGSLLKGKAAILGLQDFNF
jgi:hypothetical protein